jgi:putative two-component system response regulator
VKEEGPKYGDVMPRVLVVDDEPAFVELPQGFLTGKGYEVIAPHKPDEAGRAVLMPALPSEKPVGRRARILIADDDPLMRELLVGYAQDLGHEAVAVPDGEAALAQLAVRPPDILLSDVSMPGLSGFALCRRVKNDPATRLIPVILITGIGEEHKIEGIEAGADDFLGKPFSPAELRARIRSLLRMKAFIDELESAEAVLCTLGKSIEARDAYTEGHCERLADYAGSLGRVLGLPDADLSALRRGAYLHDLGKVAVPDAILLKNGPLTPEERRMMQQHPLVGEEICRPLRSFQAVLPIIRHHHERWDGSGYPDGLQGEAIPLTARVLQVVDVYDAITTDRPYRRALPPGAALETIEAEARRGWWDPRVVQAFREVVNGTASGAQGTSVTEEQTAGTGIGEPLAR